jgi:rRNA processing protein Gar1
MDIENSRGTLEVKLNSETDIFLANGQFGDASNLAVGQEVRVRGKMDSSGALVASLVIIGDVVDVLGDVTSAVASNVFTFTTFTGEELIGNYDVRIDPAKTLILMNCGTVVDSNAIQAGMVARVFGKVAGSEIRAVVVILRTKEVKGEITAAANVSGGRQLSVLQESGATANVFVPSAVPVYIEGDGQVSASYLTVGRQVRILLDPKIASPLTAKTVFIEGQKVEGTVSSVGAGTMVVDGLTVRVPAGATILDLRSGCSLVPFSTIKAGDEVIYFGLETSGADFEAPVILIVG